jgi:hypothetical protein
MVNNITNYNNIKWYTPLAIEMTSDDENWCPASIRFTNIMYEIIDVNRRLLLKMWSY